MPNLRIFVVFILFICHFHNTFSSPTVESQKHRFQIKEVASNLQYPWGIAFLSKQELIVTEKGGGIKVISIDTGFQALVEGGPSVSKCGQGGLMDVLLDPNYFRNKTVYFSLSREVDGVCGTEVMKGVLDNTKVKDLETIFVAQPKNQDHRHFGSRLLFLPDETLLISLGDRGHRPNGQDTTTHPGSMIRITKDGEIPLDNPFLGMDSIKPETFSYGHRNIQGLALDEENGIVWSVEHGPKGGCELNILKAGKNYGWAEITFGRNYQTGTKIGQGTTRKDVEPPIYYWTPSNAPSGMAFYNNSLFPEWQGSLFVSSLTFDLISRLELENGLVVKEERLVENQYGRIRHVQVGPEGHIYFLTDAEDGKILRIQPLQAILSR